MLDTNPFGLLFVASCCVGVVGVIVLVVLLYIAFVPRRSRGVGSPRKAAGRGGIVLPDQDTRPDA
jgi:hypothetical protein